MKPVTRDRLLIVVTVAGGVLLSVGVVLLTARQHGKPGDHPWLFMLTFFGGLTTFFVAAFFAFRISRRSDCQWSRPIRYVAQAPGWLLAALGAYVLTMLGIEQLRAGHLGLGSGFIVAVVGATIKGVSMALQNARQG